LLSALLVPRIPLLPLLVTAALVAGGGVGYCATGVARRASAAVQRAAAGENSRTTETGQRKALASAGVVAVLTVMLMLSIGFWQLDTSMAATSDRALGGSEQVGILFAAIAGGSTVGGLAFGARSWSFDERRAIPVLLCLFGLFLALLAGLLSAGAVSLLILLPVLFLTGLTIAPTLIMQQSRLDHLAPSHRLNEAQAFLSASNTTGAALGTAIAGIVIDAAGLSWSFGGAALAALFRGRRSSAAAPADPAASFVISWSGTDEDVTRGSEPTIQLTPYAAGRSAEVPQSGRIGDFADNLFQDILQRDDALSPAVLVHDPRHVRAAAS
jgi:predicted MFS family arabinose efflux permease